jgi:hypothetical protein
MMDNGNNTSKDRNQQGPLMLVRAILGIGLGGLAGYGLYRYVGCADGTCLITSSPWGSVVYCMILGFVVSQVRWSRRFADCCHVNRSSDSADIQQTQDKESDR